MIDAGKILLQNRLGVLPGQFETPFEDAVRHDVTHVRMVLQNEEAFEFAASGRRRRRVGQIFDPKRFRVLSMARMEIMMKMMVVVRMLMLRPQLGEAAMRAIASGLHFSFPIAGVHFLAGML